MRTPVADFEREHHACGCQTTDEETPDRTDPKNAADAARCHDEHDVEHGPRAAGMRHRIATPAEQRAPERRARHVITMALVYPRHRPTAAPAPWTTSGAIGGGWPAHPGSCLRAGRAACRASRPDS